MIEAVLFDVDDTLFDRDGAQREMPRLIVQAFPAQFAGLDEDAVVDAFLESDRISTRQFNWTGRVDAARIGRSRLFLDLLGLSPDLAPEITALYVDAYPRIYAPVPGAREVVENLSSRFRLGIVSNGISDVQYHKIETLGIRRWFECILLSEEAGIRKPEPEIFWRAAAVLGVSPGECVHIGDSYESDIVGAKNAGMGACWFNPGGLPLPREDVQPDFQVRSLDLIPGMLSEI